MEEGDHGWKDLADEGRIPGRLVDAFHRPGDHRWLDRRGEERIGQPDRVLLLEPVRVRGLLPQQHVRHESVGPGPLDEAAELLLRELDVDVQQRDGMEGAVPEPLERVMGRRGADEVVALAVPFGDAALAIGGEDASGLGRHAVGIGHP